MAFRVTCFGQSEDHWDAYVNDQCQYRVVSPMSTMITYYTGLQMDTSLLVDRMNGFELLKAGFRLDANTGEPICIEFVYDLDPDVQEMVFPVEVIAFDLWSPKSRAWTIRDRIIVQRQKDGLGRAQIRTNRAANYQIALVVKLISPIEFIPATDKKGQEKPLLLEGSWDNQKWEWSYFFYSVDKLCPTYKGREERELDNRGVDEDQNDE